MFNKIHQKNFKPYIKQLLGDKGAYNQHDIISKK